MRSERIIEPPASEWAYNLIWVSEDKDLDWIHTPELSEVRDRLEEEELNTYFLNFGTRPIAFAELLDPDSAMPDPTADDAGGPHGGELHMWGPPPEGPPPEQWHLLFGVGTVLRHFPGSIPDLLFNWGTNTRHTEAIVVYGLERAAIGEYLWPWSTSRDRRIIRSVLQQTGR